MNYQFNMCLSWAPLVLLHTVSNDAFLVTVDSFCYIYKTFTHKIDLDYLTMQKIYTY
jgi:hypothetical protein